MRNVVQSYKQIKMEAPASHVAATQVDTDMVVGVDNYTGPSASNNEVPTGAVIKTIDVTVSGANLVSIAGFLYVSIQHLRSGQTAIATRAQGGNPQRNQVHRTIQRSMGQDQNVNIPIRFKVPKKFQRVREGDKWVVSVSSDVLWTDAIQIIYKFYR